MSLSEKFEDLLKRKYIFHLHTNYTDGLGSVEDYCLWASKNEYDTVVFTEHVRKNLAYDFRSFLSDVEDARQRFPDLNIWVGVEAKILVDGELDIPDEILSKIQIICFACHSFPLDLDLYEKLSKNLFSDDRWRKHIRVWVHPGYFLKKSRMIDEHLVLLSSLISFALESGVFIENNLKHRLPPISIMKNIPQASLIRGLDAHSVKDVESCQIKYEQLS